MTSDSSDDISLALLPSSGQTRWPTAAAGAVAGSDVIFSFSDDLKMLFDAVVAARCFVRDDETIDATKASSRCVMLREVAGPIHQAKPTTP